MMVLDPAGQPSPDGLQAAGPLLPVAVAVHPILAQQLRGSGATPPAPVGGVGLIDTGASVSAVDSSVVSQLGIPPIGTINVGTAGGVQQQAQYPASFSFPGTGLPTINFNFVIGSNLTGQQPPIIALIGRDVLRHFVMIYNGNFGQVVLTI